MNTLTTRRNFLKTATVAIIGIHGSRASSSPWAKYRPQVFGKTSV
ncbi:MAG: twin-arginine translocation signal domain-containing protein [Opitutales bacterium]